RVSTHWRALFLSRHVKEDIFARQFVLREAPQTVELGKLPDETSLRAFWHGVKPDVLRDFWIVALGNGPGAWRIHDARALAGDDPAVVAGIIPRVDLGRIHRH